MEKEFEKLGQKLGQKYPTASFSIDVNYWSHSPCFNGDKRHDTIEYSLFTIDRDALPDDPCGRYRGPSKNELKTFIKWLLK